MKNVVLLFVIVLIQNSLPAQEYFHKYYNFQEISLHLPWSFLVEDDDLILKVGMDFCDIGSPCTSLARVEKKTGELLDVASLDILSKFSEDALIQIGNQYYVLGKELPFSNRPSVFILDEHLDIQDRIRLDLAVDHYGFVEWEGMVERNGSIYALANVRTNLNKRFGLVAKFDALTFEHEGDFFAGRSAEEGSTAEDLQMDNVGNIYVYTSENWDDAGITTHRNVITKIDVNDVVSIIDSYEDFTTLQFHHFQVIDEGNFVYSKDDFEYRHTRNWNDLLRGLNYDGDSLNTWLAEFPFEEPNADFSNLEVRKYDLFDIAAARNGDILVCGSIEDTPDSPELGGPYGQEDWGEDLPIYRAGFISRFTKYGELLWQRVFIFPNVTNSNLLEAGFEFTGDLLQVEEDENGDIFAVGRKTTRGISETGTPPLDSLWIVKTDKNGCLNVANCDEEELLLTSVSNNRIQNNFALELSPNPVLDVLNLETPLSLKSFCILNSLGQHILSGNIVGRTIDVSSLSDGIFFLTIQTKDNKIRTEKIVKTKS
jgi:hypothetical protein